MVFLELCQERVAYDRCSEQSHMGGVYPEYLARAKYYDVLDTLSCVKMYH